MEDNELSIKLKKDRAAAAVLSRDYELATRLYTQLLSADPENKELLFALGNLYERSDNNREAIPIYKKIVALDSQNVDALNSLGSIYRRLKRYDESISVLQQAVIADEKDMQTFYNLGFTYRIMEKYEDAIKCFKIVIESNPNDVLAYNHLGAIYAIQNEHKKAVSTYLMGLTIDPNHPVLHLNLAKSYEMLNNWQKANQEYEATLRSNPGWLEAIDSYADLLISNGELKNASDLVTKSLSLHPDNSELHTKMGQVYVCQKELSSAETEFNEAVRLDSKNKKALSLLASSYEQNGKLEKALQTMLQYEEAYPSDSEMLRQYASLLLSSGNFNSASRKIKQLYDNEPDSLQTLNLLSQYFICRGNEEKLQKCLKKIEKKEPADNHWKLDMARRYEQMGLYPKAESQLQDYLALNPSDRDAEAFLASVYEKDNRLEDALSIYQKLSSLDSDSESEISASFKEEEGSNEKKDEAFEESGKEVVEEADSSIPELPAEDDSEPVAEKIEELSELEAVEPNSETDLVNDLIDSAREESEFDPSDMASENLTQADALSIDEDFASAETENERDSKEQDSFKEEKGVSNEKKNDSLVLSGSLILGGDGISSENAEFISSDSNKIEKSVPLNTKVVFVKQKMQKSDTSSKKFAKEKALFCKLKELTDALPPQKKEEFQKSREYMLLDYIISRFSEKKGLLNAANKFAVPDSFAKSTKTPSILSLTKETFSSMQNYIKSLDDKYTATSLLKANAAVLSRLESKNL